MKYSKAIVEKLTSITDKRPATVIRHILKHGHITSEELENLYGYKHPPRAIRDVRERGVNIETYRVKSSDGRNIGAYRFGDPIFVDDNVSKVAGRSILSQTLKKALIEKYGSMCFIYHQPIEERLLQIDHRIPYEIGGDQPEDIDCYMLLSPSANRAKSWTCEHCPNWNIKDVAFCKHCFWAHPENYSHIAGKQQRVIMIAFTDDEVEDYEQLIKLVGQEQAENVIKQLIKDYIKNNVST